MVIWRRSLFFIGYTFIISLDLNITGGVLHQVNGPY